MSFIAKHYSRQTQHWKFPGIKSIEHTPLRFSLLLSYSSPPSESLLYQVLVLSDVDDFFRRPCHGKLSRNKYSPVILDYALLPSLCSWLNERRYQGVNCYEDTHVHNTRTFDSRTPRFFPSITFYSLLWKTSAIFRVGNNLFIEATDLKLYFSLLQQLTNE